MSKANFFTKKIGAANTAPGTYFKLNIFLDSSFILSLRQDSLPSILTSKYILIAIGKPTFATRVCKLLSTVVIIKLSQIL